MQEDQQMLETAYGLRIVVQTDYQTAIERATAALKAEGFRVLDDRGGRG